MKRTWNDVLSLPAYIVSLPSQPERYECAFHRATQAGFTDLHPWAGVDARNPETLSREWANHGSPKFAAWDVAFTTTHLGKQGCMLAHLNLIKWMIEHRLPAMVVFEDDILFHPKWDILAPVYWDQTPESAGIVFFGSGFNYQHYILPVVQASCVCTHAYLIELETAKRLYHFLTRHPSGVYTIDVMMCHYESFVLQNPMVERIFNWVCWNGRLDPVPTIDTICNSGLVIQDGNFVSSINK